MNVLLTDSEYLKSKVLLRNGHDVICEDLRLEVGHDEIQINFLNVFERKRKENQKEIAIPWFHGQMLHDVITTTTHNLRSFIPNDSSLIFIDILQFIFHEMVIVPSRC